MKAKGKLLYMDVEISMELAEREATAYREHQTNGGRWQVGVHESSVTADGVTMPVWVVVVREALPPVAATS